MYERKWKCIWFMWRKEMIIKRWWEIGWDVDGDRLSTNDDATNLQWYSCKYDGARLVIFYLLRWTCGYGLIGDWGAKEVSSEREIEGASKIDSREWLDSECELEEWIKGGLVFEEKIWETVEGDWVKSGKASGIIGEE